MISAITNRGALAFMVFQGRFHTPIFVQCPTWLLKAVGGQIYLIVGRHPVHQSAGVTRFVAQHDGRLTLIRMPGYWPELNPDERLNQDVMTHGLGASRPATRTELVKTVRRHLCRRQKQPQVIKNLFQEKHVRCAA